MEPSSPPSPPVADNTDPEHRLREAEDRLRDAIEELQRRQRRAAAHAYHNLHHHNNLDSPPCGHGPDESCFAHAIGNLCQTFLLSYGVRVGIGILLRAFKLARRQSYSSLLDLKQLVSEKDLIVREEACRIGLLFGGFTGSYHALRCLFRKLRKKETAMNAILAGSVAGFSILALNDSNRRRTLALYLLARLAQCAYNSAKSKNKFHLCRDSLDEDVSSTTTETNQNIAKPFSVEDKPDQFKANLARLGFSKDDFEDRVNRTGAYSPLKHQTDDTYPSEDVKNATPPPEYKQDENFGNSGTGFEGAKVKGEEPRHDSLFEGVSSTTTETNQNIAKPSAVEDKPEEFKADLERPGLSEDFEEQGSRIEAYTLPKYQTSDTYPSEESESKNIKPLEESLERLNVHDDEPKIQPPVADTEYPPSAGSHDQFVPHFSDATKTKNEYPQETVSTDINRNQEFSEEDSQDQGNRTEAYTLPGYQTRDTDPSGARSDEIKDFTPLEESLERLNVHDDEPKPVTEQKIKPSVADTDYPASAGSHDTPQSVPHFFDASKSHNEFSQETVSKNINKNHEIPSETEGTFNTVANTAENQPGYEESVETEPKTNKSYADENEFSSATTAEKTLPRENDEVYNLGNDGTSTGTGSNTNDGTETKTGDKGAAVRDYFNEKSRPGEEDKALAEVISEALHKGKDEPLKSEDGKFDSEAEKPEKVLEESNVASPGKGMVDRVKGVVGSWFAKSEESPSPQGAGIGKDSVAEVKHDGKVVDEGRIQE